MSWASLLGSGAGRDSLASDQTHQFIDLGDDILPIGICCGVSQLQGDPEQRGGLLGCFT